MSVNRLRNYSIAPPLKTKSIQLWLTPKRTHQQTIGTPWFPKASTIQDRSNGLTPTSKTSSEATSSKSATTAISTGFSPLPAKKITGSSISIPIAASATSSPLMKSYTALGAMIMPIDRTSSKFTSTLAHPTTQQAIHPNSSSKTSAPKVKKSSLGTTPSPKIIPFSKQTKPNV